MSPSETNKNPWKGEVLPWFLDYKGPAEMLDFSFSGKADALLDPPHV